MKTSRNTDVEVVTAQLQQIEEENQRLKQLVVDLPFYKHLVQTLLKKPR